MTDKQIIIDGVDVSGCEDYKCDGTCENSAYHLFNYDTKYAPCKNRTCYYKQLKRAEQKLAKIEEAVKYYEKQGCRYNDDMLDLLSHKAKQIIEGKENDLY